MVGLVVRATNSTDIAIFPVPSVSKLNNVSALTPTLDGTWDEYDDVLVHKTAVFEVTNPDIVPCVWGS